MKMFLKTFQIIAMLAFLVSGNAYGHNAEHETLLNIHSHKIEAVHTHPEMSDNDDVSNDLNGLVHCGSNSFLNASISNQCPSPKISQIEYLVKEDRYHSVFLVRDNPPPKI